MITLGVLLLGARGLCATPANAAAPASSTVTAPAAVSLSATVIAPVAAVPVTATMTGAPSSSATTAAAAGGWSDAELAWLRCKQAAHARDRDEGWTFDAWLNPSACPGGFRTGPARDAWDRYLKRSRDFDDCVRDRRTRTVRAFAFGGATGALVTTAVLGILRRGSTATKVTAAIGVGFVSGSLWWWRERGRPDPVCRAEPATEWPR